MLYPEVIKEKPEPLDKEDFLKQIQAELQLSRIAELRNEV